MEEIAERKPLVLVLDDLHWSDPASIEVLAALLRRGTTARVLLALGFRSGKAPAKLVAALAGATIIDLGPLSETECARLVGAGHDAEAIYAQSGGNPFYALQLAAGRRAAVAQLERAIAWRVTPAFPAWSRPRSSSSSSR